MTAPQYHERQLRDTIEPVLLELYPEGGGPDPIAAGRIAQVLWEHGWRRITAQRVEEAMNKVPNLGVEAYEPTISELVNALLSPEEQAS